MFLYQLLLQHLFVSAKYLRVVYLRVGVRKRPRNLIKDSYYNQSDSVDVSRLRLFSLK